MKKILFVLTTMRTGGISTALSNLLTELVKTKRYEISLVLFDSQSSLNSSIPPEVRIINPGNNPSVIALSLKECFVRGKILALKKIIAGIGVKIFNQEVVYKWLFRNTIIDEEWDCAISYSQSAPDHFLYGGCNEFVLSKVNAQKKISFIHCDYINYGLNTGYSHKVYQQFNQIACVSKSVRNKFLSVEPNLSNRTKIVYNCHNFEKILRLSNEEDVKVDKKRINIVTVARLSKEKGHDRAIEALANLKAQGYDFLWHVVGGSNDSMMDYLKDMVKKHQLETNIIFYGNRKNPYTIIKQSDWLLVPSLHEAAPIVYTEAAVLGVPILTTDTTSAVEFVHDQHWGKVCENNTEGIQMMLKEIMDDYSKNIKYKLNSFELSNENAINSFIEVIEN